MAITESEHPRSATTGHSAHNADYGRLIIALLATADVRITTGSDSGPGLEVHCWCEAGYLSSGGLGEVVVAGEGMQGNDVDGPAERMLPTADG
jgi:hypothetical protein